jgi:superfamily II DNA or RNA helicase
MIILDSKLRIPWDKVSYDILNAFKSIIKDKDGNEQILEFYYRDVENEQIIFPRGNAEALQNYFGHLLPQVIDRRSKAPMRVRDLTFTKSLYPNQQTVIDKFLRSLESPFSGGGQIIAPPRFGKTVVMTWLACHLKLKTLFLNHQTDLSKQAIKTFYKMTNIIDLEYIHNRQIIGLIEDWEDLDKDYDVAFMPYQKFLSENGRERLQEYANQYGAIFIDESHRAAAEGYSRTIGNMNSYIRIGFTGTPERKDQLHIINDYIIGPELVRGEAPQIPCEVQVVRTGVRVPYQAGSNMFFVLTDKYLTDHKDRNALILSYLLAYAKAGHSILVLAKTTRHVEYFAKTLTEAGFKAEAYHAKRFKNNEEREACLNRLRAGESQVMVAIRKMTLGLDIPRLTAVFNIMPMSNEPDYFQEICRVRTPYEGKEKGFIVDFVDEHHIHKAQYKTRRRVYSKEGFPIKGDLVGN